MASVAYAINKERLDIATNLKLGTQMEMLSIELHHVTGKVVWQRFPRRNLQIGESAFEFCYTGNKTLKRVQQWGHRHRLTTEGPTLFMSSCESPDKAELAQKHLLSMVHAESSSSWLHVVLDNPQLVTPDVTPSSETSLTDLLRLLGDTLPRKSRGLVCRIINMTSFSWGVHTRDNWHFDGLDCQQC